MSERASDFPTKRLKVPDGDTRPLLPVAAPPAKPKVYPKYYGSLTYT